ncbi:hypothetical protein M9H77_30930 [Catharanthus roseus]|uniref:Uncharacterized protein n=1 Tax=Catharanthus roseus TaxID=4058 RepID=A0ACB9ZYL6_CATRO|nr:hypothetical protein M9H77_30930 [Catharanthus roseus]
MEQPAKSDLVTTGRNDSRKLKAGTISEGIGGQISTQITSLNKICREQHNRKISRPAKTGQNKDALLSPTTQAIRYHYSLRADRGNVKSMSLTKFGNSIHAPWLVLGDFNSVLKGSDRNGNAHVSSLKTSCIVSKIDRAMCTQSWFYNGLQASAKLLPIDCLSNHSLCVSSLFKLSRSPKNCFMCFNIWCAYEDFPQLMETGWEELILGTKKFYFALNKEHFDHISTRVELAREELKVAQSSLHDNSQDTTLREMVRDLQQKTRRLCEAERKFFAQKTKCNFLLQENTKRRFISSLTRDDGSTTSSVDEIHIKFLVYYSNLLGTRENVDDLDDTVMYFCPKVSPFKVSLFLCAVVLGFFEFDYLLKQTNRAFINLILKNENASRVGDFRSISCCNVFDKVLSEVQKAFGGVSRLKVKKDFPLVVNRIISIKDKIIETEGSILNAIAPLSSWHLIKKKSKKELEDDKLNSIDSSI